MSAETTIPADFPPLVQAAEEAAREQWDAHVDVCSYGLARWAQADRTMRADRVAANMRLLADLSRPASRDYWARYLAQRVRLAVGATAPRWIRGGTDWCLRADLDEHWFSSFADMHIVPGISEIPDPAAALKLCLLSLPVTP